MSKVISFPPSAQVPLTRDRIRKMVEEIGYSEATRCLPREHWPTALEIHDEMADESIQDHSDIGEDVGKDPLGYAFTHSGFCVTCLPHSSYEGQLTRQAHKARTDAQLAMPVLDSLGRNTLAKAKEDYLREKWQVSTGRAKLVVEPLEHPILQQYLGVPFGALGRLVLLHLQSAAIINRSPVIDIGTSLTNFTKRIGASDASSSRKNVADQFNRIASCQFTVVWGAGNERVDDVDLPDSPLFGAASAQPAFFRIPLIKGATFMRTGPAAWAREVVLDDGFYNALLEHPVPVDEHALQRIKDSSFAIDLYLWLAWRLREIKRPTRVSWRQIAKQFGHANTSWFRQDFRARLKEVREVYPAAKVDWDFDAGLILRRSPSPVAAKPTVQVLFPSFSDKARDAG